MKGSRDDYAEKHQVSTVGREAELVSLSLFKGWRRRGWEGVSAWGGQELYSAPTSRDSQGEYQQGTLQKHDLDTFCQAGQGIECVRLTAELALVTVTCHPE